MRSASFYGSCKCPCTAILCLLGVLPRNCGWLLNFGGRRYHRLVRAGAHRRCRLKTTAITERMQWGRLIRAIATDQDRAAFATLFEYFAPRIKAFLQRSGASEASAEELAQETMLAVWRKASLFDPDSAGAAAWIFTIARNLRIDAHRHDRRGGAIESSDVELEFQIDDAPRPDSRLATAQSEERVRWSSLDLKTI